VNTSTTARQARRVLEQERRTGQVMSEGERLFFAGHELPMDVVLSEAGVVDGSRVFVDPEHFTVFVKLPNNKVHKLAVQMSDSVRILRARITDELGWPADKIGTLMHAGEPMADEKMLHDCAFETDGSGAITVLEPLQPGKNKWGSVNTSYLWGGSAMKVNWAGKPPDSAPHKALAKQPSEKIVLPDIDASQPGESKEAQAELALIDEYAQRRASRRSTEAYYEHDDEGFVEPEVIVVPPEAQLPFVSDGQAEVLQKGDLDFHYVTCCMRVMPCLRPKADEEPFDSDDEVDVSQLSHRGAK